MQPRPPVAISAGLSRGGAGACSGAVVDKVENVWLQTALCEVKSGAPERAAASVATMHDAYVVKNFLMRAGLAILFLRAVLLGGRKGVDRWRGQEVR